VHDRACCAQHPGLVANRDFGRDIVNRRRSALECGQTAARGRRDLPGARAVDGGRGLRGARRRDVGDPQSPLYDRLEDYPADLAAPTPEAERPATPRAPTVAHAAT
jgi:hypothetical protein